jgi:hypothetical protein
MTRPGAWSEPVESDPRGGRAAFDPYHRWLGIPPKEQPPDCYRLLGVSRFESDPDVIEAAADQRMAFLRTLQTGPHGKRSQELLNEVAAAKLRLLNPEKKAAYDQELRRRAAAQATDAGAAHATPAKPVAVFVSPGDGVALPRVSLQATRRAARSRASRPLIVSASAAVLALVCVGAWLASRPGENGDHAGEAIAGSRSHGGTTVRASEDARHARPVAPTTPSDVAAQFPIDTADAPAGSSGELPDALASRLGEPLSMEPAPPESSDPWATEPADEDASAVASHGGYDAPVFIPPESPSAPQNVASAPLFEAPDLVEPSPAEPPVPRPSPIPGEEVQRTIHEQLSAIHRLDVARTADEKNAAARRFLEAADAAATSPAERYVLLRLAAQLATETGDVDLALEAAGRFGRRFEVDPVRAQVEALKAYAAKATGVQRLESLVGGSAGVIHRAVAEQRFAEAIELAALVQTACRRPEGRDWRKEAADRLAWAERMAAQNKEIARAKSVLETNADDPEANTLLGTWYCLVEAEWQPGLKHLARGRDEAIRNLAQADLAALAGEGAAVPHSPTTTDPGDVAPEPDDNPIARGDAWWDAAQALQDDARLLALSRAGDWYRRAKPETLGGLSRLKVEKRLGEIAEVEQTLDARRAAMRPPPGRNPAGTAWREVW